MKKIKNKNREGKILVQSKTESQKSNNENTHKTDIDQ